MPIYYFHLSFGERIMPDEEGIELPNRAAARDEAQAVVRDLSERAGRRWASWFLDITDEHGSFLRLPIGYPALEVLPKEGRPQLPAAPELDPADPLPPLEVAAEGALKSWPAALASEKLAISQRTAALLERNRQLRAELASQFSLSQQIRHRTRMLLSAAQFVGWFGDCAVTGADEVRQARAGRPQLVVLPGGAPLETQKGQLI